MCNIGSPLRALYKVTGQVRYLVPTWVSPSSLEPTLAAALGAPPNAVEVG